MSLMDFLIGYNMQVKIIRREGTTTVSYTNISEKNVTDLMIALLFSDIKTLIKNSAFSFPLPQYVT